MAQGVTDVFQEDLNSMVGGGFGQPDERERQRDEEVDWMLNENEPDQNNRSALTDFDELD